MGLALGASIAALQSEEGVPNAYLKYIVLNRDSAYVYSDAGKEFAVTCNQETAITLPGNRIKKVVLLEGSQKKELPFMQTKTGITFSVLACSQAGILLN
jgi:hypothetical protein